MFKVSNDKSVCIGCGACTSVCDNWEIKEGKGNPKETLVAEPGCNLDAENICPVHCIKVEKIE